MNRVRSGLLCLLSALLLFPIAAKAEEHAVQKGETALQIAIDHNITLDQLQQLNPGVDLEAMLIGDPLIVPDEGMSFEEFRSLRYSEMIRIRDLQCSPLADHSALCFLHAENGSSFPLFDVQLRVGVHDANGSEKSAEGSIALMQILPGELMPMVLTVPGNFSSPDSFSVTVTNLSYSDQLTGSFRIPEDRYTLVLQYTADRAAVTASIRFSAEAENFFQDRQINVLAAAYDASDHLVGVRSLYSSFFSQLDITVYTADQAIDHLRVILEAY